MTCTELTDREKKIFFLIVHSFITTAEPVGSRYLSRNYGLDISPATIRNVMSDLEDKGLIYQPHTSAGRMPTTTGYRHYVDDLDVADILSDDEKQSIFKELQRFAEDVDHITTKAADVLSDISSQLGVVLAPRFNKGVLQKIDLVSISEQKILLILSIKSGIVKTVIMEIENQVSSDFLAEISQIINERLHGLTIEKIINSFDDIFADFDYKRRSFVRSIKKNASTLLTFDPDSSFYYAGTRKVFLQPEFESREKMERILELLDRKDILISVLSKRDIDGNNGVSIVIGEENKEELMRNCSLVTATYNFEGIEGTIGVVGPTRMQYPKVIALVKYMSEMLSYMVNRKK